MTTHQSLEAAKAAAAKDARIKAVLRITHETEGCVYINVLSAADLTWWRAQTIPGIKMVQSVHPVEPPKPVLTDAQKMQIEISKLKDLAETSNDPTKAISAQNKAERMQAEYAVKYPEEAKAEKKAKLMDAADYLRQQAKVALVTSADGWYDESVRQARHDEKIARAETLEAEANSL